MGASPDAGALIGKLSPVCFFLVLLLWTGSLEAMTQDAPDTPDSSVRQTYSPADFTRFAPRTALDMARQVPGFPIEEGDQERGFGQADTNVLVNGRRVSGKSNGPVEALERIPVADVVRLEILDGASLDIGGLSGQVLNVVTASGGGITGRYRYSPEVRTDGVDMRWGNGALSISGGKQQTEWTLSLTNDQQKFGSEGPEFVTDGDGLLTDERSERVRESFDQPSLGGSLTRKLNGGNILNLTGEVNWFLFKFDEVSERFPIADTAQVRELRQSQDEFNFEVGADYEFSVGEGRLKIIGLYRFEDSPNKAETDFAFADGRPAAGSEFERRAKEAETVLRAEYTFSALGGDWQWSAEGTHNYLDVEAELFVRDDLGLLVPAALPGGSARVEEDRAEMTLSYSRPLTSALQLQTSFGAEYSQIRQSGEFGQTRDFVRPKGFASLNWRANDDLNLSLQFERQVGQLNFSDVIATVNVNQNQVNVTNANLVPPQSWLTELQMQRSLGEFGSITVSGFYEDISDIVDLIPIDGGGQAPGNIDSAKRYGGSVNTTLLFDPLGWNGVRLDIEASFTDSEVSDPLLGNTRQISNDDHIDYAVNLRKDFPRSNWAIGLGLFFGEDTPQVRLDEVSLFRQSVAFTRLFIENKDVFGATLRGSIANLNDRSNNFSRTRFNDRITNDIDFREQRFLDFGLIFRLEVEGNF